MSYRVFDEEMQTSGEKVITRMQGLPVYVPHTAYSTPHAYDVHMSVLTDPYSPLTEGRGKTRKKV